MDHEIEKRREFAPPRECVDFNTPPSQLQSEAVNRASLRVKKEIVADHFQRGPRRLPTTSF